jgi:hypothetical protein
MIKRVGDGSSISIWTDKWIPGKLSMSPAAHIGEETLHRVFELMSEDRNSWDIQKIRKNFIAPDADAILNIPIRSGGDDHWAWALEKSGNYTVKSAYRSLVIQNE